MYLVDSCGWLEYFSGGRKAKEYEKYLADPDKLLLPSIVIYEVYKKAKSKYGEDKALFLAANMQSSRTVPFDDDTALLAADLSLEYSIPMADSIIYATAIKNRAVLITSDEHLKGLKGVEFI